MMAQDETRAKRLNWFGLIVLAALATAGLTNGCGGGAKTPPASPPALPHIELSDKTTEESLRPYVGKKIVISGFWDLSGKPGPFIRSQDPRYGEPIYIESSTEAGLGKMNEIFQMKQNGSPIRVTGMLHLFDPGPPPTPPADPRQAVPQISPKHFYFHAEEIDMVFGDPKVPTR